MAWIAVYEYCFTGEDEPYFTEEPEGITSTCRGAAHNRRACQHEASVYAYFKRVAWAATLHYRSAARKRARKALKKGT